MNRYESQANGSGPKIKFVDVSKEYRQSKSGVSDITFEVKPNQVLGLLGNNGCGKTTLINLMTGLEKPDRGDIKVDGSVSLC